MQICDKMSVSSIIGTKIKIKPKKKNFLFMKNKNKFCKSIEQKKGIQ